MKTLLAEVFLEALTGAVEHFISEKTIEIQEKTSNQIEEINNNDNLSCQEKNSLRSKEHLKGFVELLPYAVIEKKNNKTLAKLESLNQF